MGGVLAWLRVVLTALVCLIGSTRAPSHRGAHESPDARGPERASLRGERRELASVAARAQHADPDGDMPWLLAAPDGHRSHRGAVIAAAEAVDVQHTPTRRGARLARGPPHDVPLG